MRVMTRVGAAAAAIALLAGGCATDGRATQGSTDGAVETAPLQVTDMDGGVHDLDAALARGETVALVFWQTWCTSCKAEAPAIAAAATEHGAKIRFLGVVPGRDDTVSDAEVRKTHAAWGYEFPQVRDRDMALTRRFKVKGTPTILVLGEAREVLFDAHRPPVDWKPLEGAPIASAKGGAAQDSDFSGVPGMSPEHSTECKDGVCPLPEAAE